MPDRPGFGISTPTPKQSYAFVAGDLLAVVDHAGVERFGIAAQSGGTPFALALAAVGGERVTGTAFVGALAPLRDHDALTDVTGPMRTVFRLARSAPWWLRPLFGIAARQTRKDPEAVARKFVEDLPAADRAVLADPVNWTIHATTSAEILSHPRALAVETRMLAQPWGIDYTGIHSPSAFWAGELDGTHPPRMSRRLAKLLRDAPVTVVDGAATFALSACYPDALRHAAALPEDGLSAWGQRERHSPQADDRDHPDHDDGRPRSRRQG